MSVVGVIADQNIEALSRQNNIDSRTVHRRMSKQGMTLEEALTRPVLSKSVQAAINSKKSCWREFKPKGAEKRRRVK